ncbi:MAG: hypothetical protein R3Y05_05810 [bacterium]
MKDLNTANLISLIDNMKYLLNIKLNNDKNLNFNNQVLINKIKTYNLQVMYLVNSIVEYDLIGLEKNYNLRIKDLNSFFKDIEKNNDYKK